MGSSIEWSIIRRVGNLAVVTPVTAGKLRIPLVEQSCDKWFVLNVDDLIL